MSERYVVDERVGCVAVVDNYMRDPDCPGLHRDTIGVVRFWQGRWRRGRWHVSWLTCWAAHLLCRRLNRRVVDSGPWDGTERRTRGPERRRQRRPRYGRRQGDRGDG